MFAIAEDCYKQHNAIFMIHYAYPGEHGPITGVFDYNRELHGKSIFDTHATAYEESGILGHWEDYAKLRIMRN